jgi:hypothetical protein
VENNNEKTLVQRKVVRVPFRVSNSGRDSVAGVALRNRFSTGCRSKALILVDAILCRGNAAQLKNVGENFVVTELVVNHE